MNFSKAFTELYCSRFENRNDLEPLISCAEYQRQREALEAALEIGGARDTGDIWKEIVALGDIVSQFYYRAGVRDGASIAADSFLVPAW